MTLIRTLLLAACLAVFAAAGAQTAAAQGADPLENVVLLDLKDGRVTILLRPDLAPKHVERVKQLTREGFYDGIVFHRVIPGFVAQAGDPTGTGRGGPGYTIQDEVNAQKFVDGALGMAKTSAPNSAGSQWFLCYGPQTNLDGGYTVFGTIVEGRDVLDKITPRDPQAASAPGTKINTIVIEEI